jgi:superfamily II DNA helicase RecQ
MDGRRLLCTAQQQAVVQRVFWDWLKHPVRHSRLTRPAFCSGVGGRGKVDYKEVLNADDFAVFARLRVWRKDVAQQEGIPLYTVFTNEQLAQIVQQRVQTKADLQANAGVGDARVEKYGPRLLEVLQAVGHPRNEAHAPPV